MARIQQPVRSSDLVSSVKQQTRKSLDSKPKEAAKAAPKDVSRTASDSFVDHRPAPPPWSAELKSKAAASMSGLKEALQQGDTSGHWLGEQLDFAASHSTGAYGVFGRASLPTPAELALAKEKGLKVGRGELVVVVRNPDSAAVTTVDQKGLFEPVRFADGSIHLLTSGSASAPRRSFVLKYPPTIWSRIGAKAREALDLSNECYPSSKRTASAFRAFDAKVSEIEQEVRGSGETGNIRAELDAQLQVLTVVRNTLRAELKLPG